MLLIIDFGSQFNQLIARSVRECGVYCQVMPPTITLQKIKALNVEGIILSGGPSSVYEKEIPSIDAAVFDLKIPILGICYGMQYIVHFMGGRVRQAQKREYGFAELVIQNQTHPLFKEIDSPMQCWMSHGDSIKTLPPGFNVTASTTNTPIGAVINDDKLLYGLQFHPEVEHTPKGQRIIRNFLFEICHAKRTWSMKSFAEKAVADIRKQVGKSRVILGLSGGVDSSVAALLLHRAIAKNLTCIFVDNGLMRKNEAANLKKRLKDNLNITIRFISAKNLFLKGLKDVENPERKRKIIGKIFMQVFEKEAKKIKDARFLAQGTLYPDIIESRSAFGGPSAVIKSHHNVGGLPKNMKLKLVEPLKYLFKDEVRRLGKELGLDEDLIWRQPFPGPGLAIRIIGSVNRRRLQLLREVDYVLLNEIRKSGYYRKIWQSFAVLLPLKTVGIMGDHRTYENIIAIRAVTSKDAMTADWARLPNTLLSAISNRIINEVKGVNRVVYDISSKPPSTIEWE